jgi:hypothetical protein
MNTAVESSPMSSLLSMLTNFAFTPETSATMTAEDEDNLVKLAHHSQSFQPLRVSSELHVIHQCSLAFKGRLGVVQKGQASPNVEETKLPTSARIKYRYKIRLVQKQIQDEVAATGNAEWVFCFNPRNGGIMPAVERCSRLVSSARECPRFLWRIGTAQWRIACEFSKPDSDVSPRS